MNEIILEISALGIGIFCLVECLHTRKDVFLAEKKEWIEKLKDRHFVYFILLVLLIVSSFFSVLEVCVEHYAPIRSAFMLDFCNYMYFIFHTVLGYVFILYIINLTGAFRRRGKVFYFVFSIPIILAETFILLNPFTGLAYFIDENCTYNRGPHIWVVYAVGFFYVIAGIIVFMTNMKLIPKLDRSAVFILVFITILGICIQGLFSIMVELFFESVGMFGFLLLLENRRTDRRQGRHRKMNRRYILVIAFLFLSVVTMNINLIYYAGMEQAGKISEIQMNSLKGELQQTLSDSEGYLLKYAMGLEQLITESADMDELERYITEQNDYYSGLRSANCISAYAASPEWLINPGFDLPEDFDPTERIWYLGAKEHPGEICISEPYIDMNTGELCYTFSYLLSDRKTVAGMDYSLTKVQDVVKKMAGKKDQFSIIVTDSGTIVGCSLDVNQGKELSEVMPSYTDAFERVKASSEHKSFKTNIGGNKKIVFGSNTSNGWLLILVVDYGSFYQDIFERMIMVGAVDILMVTVIIVFYLVSVINQEKAENTLENTEDFIASLSGELSAPLGEILRISEAETGQGAASEAMMGINIAGKKLKDRINDLFAYSNILKTDTSSDAKKLKKKKAVKTDMSRLIRNGILVIIGTAMIIGLAMCVAMTVRWGKARITNQADRFGSDVALWMEQKKSMLMMFSDVIAADPSVLDDYDSAVKWLDDISRNYSEITFAYMANPHNKEHPVIMNNGWVPDADYKVEERQWYIDTKHAKGGFNISAPYFDAQTGLYCITFSRVVYSTEGKFLGVFAIDCLMDKLIDVLDNSYTDGNYAFMVDQDGTIINHPNKEYEISPQNSVNIEDTEYADAYHRGSTFEMHDYDGKRVSCYTENSLLSGFTVVVVQDWWSIYGPLFIVSVVFFLMIVVSIASVIIMINRFTGWQEETNARLVEAAESAVAAKKAKSRFLAQMSHEIRTPINAVLGMNEMILRESGDGSIREYAGNIRASGKNLLGLINSILDFSKIEEGKMEIIPVRYDTSVMIENIINSVSKRAKDKGIVFETHIDSNLPSTLYGDDMRITQVVVNLLTNAIKYTREGRVDLYMEGLRNDTDTVSLRVSVNDTGIGIKEEDIGRLFESFTRLEETKNRSIEGTGLGMAIVNGLLEMMDSSLNVESVYGKGSRFSFEVSQKIIDDSPIGDYEAKARQILEKDDEERYLYAPEAKLLVVDDIEMNIKVISNLLKLNGIIPDTANSGKETLEKLKTGNYDVVLLDHMMPEMDGIETLQAAKDEGLIPEGCTVIALTANAVSGAREIYLKAGFEDYLTKPLEIKSLEKALAKYLPQEKVSYRTKTSSDEGNAGEEMDGSGEDTVLDTGTGLTYCGGDETFYREMLKDYLNSGEERISELESALSDNDLKMYAIKVHALKSLSRSIGALKLADHAQELENSANGEDAEAVRNGHPALVEKLRAVLNHISSMDSASGQDIQDENGSGGDNSTSDDEILEFMPDNP
ncbi:MAG: response regulator [Lachnospiraceae bacterium]|nr:response regulator [Lachnospiraceae bacterium]